MARPKVTSRLRIGIRRVESAQYETLEQNPDHADGDRRDHDSRAEADIIRQCDGHIGAESVKCAVRQIHHTADAEDQRQAKCDQQVVASEDETVDHLLQQEHEWDSLTIGTGGGGSSVRSVNDAL